jgi:hypothetical protein
MYLFLERRGTVGRDRGYNPHMRISLRKLLGYVLMGALFMTPVIASAENSFQQGKKKGGKKGGKRGGSKKSPTKGGGRSGSSH